MTDRKALVDPNETPEDVATLYSWANLHGAKYRDFSASRAQTREQARQRVQDALEAERHRAHDEADEKKLSEVQQSSEAEREAEKAPHAEAETKQTAVKAEQQAGQQAAQYIAQGLPQRSRESNNGYSVSLGAYAAHAAAVNPMQPHAETVDSVHAAAEQRFTPYQPPAQPAAAAQPVGGQGREEQAHPSRNGMAPSSETREAPVRPAWLAGERSEASSTVAHAPDDTLQGSRDRLTSRWFALKGVFSGAPVQVEAAAPPPSSQRAPVLAVFSLAGGVGKTCLVATLGRALSARSERVLLVDTTSFGILPFFFGARDQRPGVLRTFSPPGSSGDVPIQMLSVDPDTLGPENAAQEALSQEITRNGREANRVIVDLGTASASVTRRVLRMAPTVLVPVVPDMSSVVSVGSIDAFFHRNPSGAGHSIPPFYVLNQFDPSLPLHLDVREVLREQLGDRLLPFALRRAPAVSEALAEGMTVVDYAPNSTVTEDFGALANWVKSLAAPATNSFRGVRWSEK